MKTIHLRRMLSMACALLLFALWAGGCGSSDGMICTQNIVRGIEVAVFDARTHAPAAMGATGTVQDGSFTQMLRPTSSDAMSNLIGLGGADERAGTYTVRIEKAGYIPWERTNVRVTKNVCHVNTVMLEADLQPAN